MNSNQETMSEATTSAQVHAGMEMPKLLNDCASQRVQQNDLNSIDVRRPRHTIANVGYVLLKTDTKFSNALA
jgi:CxxC motif-containing protein (DUF1111 family)